MRWLWLLSLSLGCSQTPMLEQWRGAPREAPALDIVPSTARPQPQSPFELRIHGHWPVTATVLEPQYPSYITELRVVEYRRAVTDVGDERQLDVRLTVQADMSGVYRIAPIPVVLEYPTGRTAVLRTLPLFVEITLEAARDVTDIRDIKLLRHLPWNYTWAMPVVVGLVSLLCVGGLVWLLLWWRRRATRSLTPLETLEQVLRVYLRDAGLQSVDRTQAFALSESARRYVELRHGMRALEMTAAEFALAVGQLPADAEGQRLQDIVRVCRELEDVKFSPDGAAQIPVAKLAARIWDAAHGYDEQRTQREARERGKGG